jgi:hypothetical protein
MVSKLKRLLLLPLLVACLGAQTEKRWVLRFDHTCFEVVKTPDTIVEVPAKDGDGDYKNLKLLRLKVDIKDKTCGKWAPSEEGKK